MITLKADGFGTKAIARLNRTPRTARFLIPAFGAVRMDVQMRVTVNGDGNRRAVIFQGMYGMNMEIQISEYI